MFAEALDSISNYTHPVVVSQRRYNGTVTCGIATFIILNSEGWMLTSAHVLGALVDAKHHAAEIAEYKKRKHEIESDKTINKNQRRKRLKKLLPNNQWITNQSFWWGMNGATVKEFKCNTFLDLAAGKLEPFDENSVSTYPIFKDPERGLPIGTSLCRLGFPFHNINATFDEKANGFELEKGALPLPRFPIEGIHTRVAIQQDEKSGKTAKFIETSSPGLRGQSGGPIFDKNGSIWGLQSRTIHLPLGFSPTLTHNRKKIEEHQFINVGLGTHVEDIINFLEENRIQYNLSST